VFRLPFLLVDDVHRVGKRVNHAAHYTRQVLVRLSVADDFRFSSGLNAILGSRLNLHLT
jgi:hypothetical protein